MKKQKRFTKEFEDEAVRLEGTSGRTKRQIADDLGIGLSTLTRPWSPRPIKPTTGRAPSILMSLCSCRRSLNCRIRSLGGTAAADQQMLAADERGKVASEVFDRIRDVLDRAHPLDRVELADDL